MSVTCVSVVTTVVVDVRLTVVVLGGGVIVVTGVEVDLIVALLVKVKANTSVGTGFTEFLPSRVVQASNDLVESAEATEKKKQKSKAPERSFVREKVDAMLLFRVWRR